MDDHEETAISGPPAMGRLLGEDAPSNWGRWGPDDEVGALNHLDAAEVLRGLPLVAAKPRSCNEVA